MESALHRYGKVSLLAESIPYCYGRVSAPSESSPHCYGKVSESSESSIAFAATLSKYTTSKSHKCRLCVVSPAGTQRGGGFTQAGASVRLGREQKTMLPALCQTRLPPACVKPLVVRSPFYLIFSSYFYQHNII